MKKKIMIANKYLITMAPTKDIAVSIIIVNYNTLELIINCIRSIFNNVDNISFEIIIVDNASPDNSGRSLKQYYISHSLINIVLLNENIGFGKANNVGVKHANGRNIFFLNPDTILINNSIKILSDYLDSFDKTGAVGGNLYDENYQPAHSFNRLFPSIFSEFSAACFHLPEYLKFRKNQRFNYTELPLSVAYITGADLMIKKEVLDRVGYFNPIFFMYYEETELCWRIKNMGYDIVSCPQSKIQHLEGKSSSNMKRKASIVYQSRKCYYKVTHKDRWYYYWANLFFFISCIEHIIFDSLRKSGGKVYWYQMLKLLFS